METGLLMLDILLVVLLMIGVFRHERKHLKDEDLGWFSYRTQAEAQSSRSGPEDQPRDA